MIAEWHPLNLPCIFQTKLHIFSLNKILKIKTSFKEWDTKKTYHRKCTKFTSFVPLEKDEILSIINNINPTNCITDPCNTNFLLKYKYTILDTNSFIVNQYLTMGTFLEGCLLASVRPLIKGQNIETKFINYRPISNLSFLIQNEGKDSSMTITKPFQCFISPT